MATQCFFIGWGSGSIGAAGAFGRGVNTPTKLQGGANTAWSSSFALHTARDGFGTGSPAVATATGPTAGIELHSGGVPFEFVSAPLAAGVTISGTITVNLRGLENNMSANVTLGVLIDRVGPDGAIISRIASGVSGTELGTAEGALNFTLTPTSTTMAKGDRIRAVVYADDAGTMATGFTWQFFYGGGSGAGTSGDSYITFNETFSFMGSSPSGSQVFLTDNASPVATAAVDREAWTSRGAGVQTDVRNTTAGFTAPLQMTDTAGGTVVDWWTRPLVGDTLVGPVLANMRFLRSATATSSTFRVEIAICDNDGTNPVVWASTGHFNAPTTTEAAFSCVLAGPDTAFSSGQRLRIRVYIDDANAAMVTGQTVTLFYAGTSGGASGDSYLTFSQTLVESTVTASPGLIDNSGVVFAPEVDPPRWPLITSGPQRDDVSDGTLGLGGFASGTTDSWPALDTGQTWSDYSLAAADFDSAGGVGTITTSASGIWVAFVDNNIGSAQFVRARVKTSRLTSAVGTQGVGLLLKSISTTRYFGMMIIDLNGNGNWLLQLYQRNGGTASSVGTNVDSGIAKAANTYFNVLFGFSGVKPSTFFGKVWADGDPEPSDWQFERTILPSTLSYQDVFGPGITGDSGVLVSSPSDGGSFPVTYTYDDLEFSKGAKKPHKPGFQQSSPLALTPGLINQSGVVYDPTIRPNQFLTPALISQLGITMSPSMVVRVSPGLISQLGAPFSPTVIQQQFVTPGLISQLGTTFAPSMKFAISMGLIDQSGVIFSPNVAPKQTLTPALIAQLGVVFSPQINQMVALGLITQLGVPFTPNIIASQFLTPGLIAQLGITFSPSVAATVKPGLISQLGVVFAPTQMTQQVLLGLISQLGVTFAPTKINQSLTPGLIQQLGITLSPQINQQVVAQLIQQLGVTFTPQVNRSLPLGLISQLGVVFAPTQMTQQVLAQLITQLGQVFAPILNQAGGAQFTAPGLISQLGVLFNFNLIQNQFLTPGLISQAGQVFTPEVDSTLPMGLIPSTVLLFSPQVNTQLQLGLISQAGQVSPPVISPLTRLDVGLITSNPQLFDFITHRGLPVALIVNLGQVFTPVFRFPGSMYWLGRQSGFAGTKRGGWPIIQTAVVRTKVAEPSGQAGLSGTKVSEGD